MERQKPPRRPRRRGLAWLSVALRTPQQPKGWLASFARVAVGWPRVAHFLAARHVAHAAACHTQVPHEVTPVVAGDRLCLFGFFAEERQVPPAWQDPEGEHSACGPWFHDGWAHTDC